MSGYRTVDAPTGHELSACVQCGLCLPHCPTFRLTGTESASPRGRLTAMRAVLDGVAQVDDAFDEVISFCLGCRACEAVCPGLVPYGRLLEGARTELATQRPGPGRRLRRLALGRLLPSRPLVRAGAVLAAIGQRLGMARLPGFVGRALGGMRDVGFRQRSWTGRTADAVGPWRGTAVLFTGCVMDAWFTEVHDATVDLLTRAGYRVEAPAAQTCCGALAAHDGHADVARTLARRNLAVLESADLVVVDAAGCSAHLKEYAHLLGDGARLAGKVRDVTEVIAGLIADGTLPTLPAGGERVAVQDPCHLRHAQRIVAEPRAILRAAGLVPVEIDPDGLCCGAAGIYMILRPEASNELGRRKVSQIEATGVSAVASANPGCEMQLRAGLGRSVRVAHPIEWYRERLAAEGYAADVP